MLEETPIKKRKEKKLILKMEVGMQFVNLAESLYLW